MIEMEILRRAQMEKAFGELRALVSMHYSCQDLERYREIKKMVENFIEEMKFNFG